MNNTPPIIAGIDEAGRGPLAGPVVAGACVITIPLQRTRKMGRTWWMTEEDIMIADSKDLTPEERELAFTWTTAHCPHGIGISSAEEIDAMGILAATEKAMHQALEALQKHVTPTYLVVDGRDHFWFDLPHSPLIRGEQEEPTIAAASILAKVTRDRMMCAEAENYPQYHFEIHKGYGTSKHLATIERHGPCPLHRRSFLRNMALSRVSNNHYATIDNT